MTESPEARTPILPPVLAAKVGEFIVTWSGTQWLLTMLMMQLMLGPKYTTTDDLTACLPVIGMEARTQMAMLKTMLRMRLPETAISPLDKILERIEKIKKIRDVVSHCIWEPGKKGDEMYGSTLKTTHRARMFRYHFTPDRLNFFTASLQDRVTEFVTALQSHGYLAELIPFYGRYV